MKYDMISADGHIDLVWMPPDLFTSQAPAAMKDRMPYVVETSKGPLWVTKQGAKFGLMNGMGSAGRPYVPGEIHRSDRMAETGLFEDGKKGIRRLTEPELRIQDMERDGVQAEVIYGILGAGMRMNDPEASLVLYTIYNEWLADFCDTHPERFAGLASIPGHDVDAALAEIDRVLKRGGLRGIEVANHPTMVPLWHDRWEPLWARAAEARVPVHFHTLGGKMPTAPDRPQQVQRAAFASFLTTFQMVMANMLSGTIFSGCLERHPNLRIIFGEGGIGWIPYLLDRMDMEWEEQFKDLDLTMKPSDYWHRQCKATYQSDPIGLKLLEELGPDNVMWGSDYPHPDGIWPDSQTVIQQELSHVPEALRRKVVCENAASVYGFKVA